MLRYDRYHYTNHLGWDRGGSEKNTPGVVDVGHKNGVRPTTIVSQNFDKYGNPTTLNYEQG
jgi:hypothetical protein